jgi:hypothetical protein
VSGGDARWGRDFEPDRLALIELRMWKAYYRRQPLRLFGLLVLANREQARVSWLTAFGAAFFFVRAAVAFARSTGPGRAYRPEVARLLRDSYRSLGAAVAPTD